MPEFTILLNHVFLVKVSVSMVGGRHHRWLLIADLAWMAIASWIATGLRTGQFRGDVSLQGLAGLIPSAIVSATVWIAVCNRMSLDRPGRYSEFPELLSRILIAVTLFIAVVLALAFMARDLFSRLAFIYFGVLLVSGFSAIRGIARYVVVKFRSEFA